MKNLKDYFPEIIEESVAQDAAKAMNKSIETVDPNLSYKDFALAVAAILKDEYGSHNFKPFMEILHAELGMNESLNENDAAEDLGMEFSKEFDVRAFSTPYKIEIIYKDDIDPTTFKAMIKWVEDKGYKVNTNQSDPLFDKDDDRYYYPRIIFSK